MLAKNISRPIIGKLARMGFSDPATSPRSPLDAKIQSPKGTKNYDVGGVGLGIVVALEKSDNAGGSRNPVLVRSLSRSNPIPVNQESHNNKYTNGGYREKMKLDWEDYTFVTRHEPNNSYTSTRVYRDTVGRDRRNRNIAPVFDISPADEQSPAEVYRGSADFLSCCQLCQKKLHGKDIYMYRGEKAYCSTECRYEQILMDERKEKNQKKKYSSSRSSTSGADISSSPYPNNGQMFYTGILAV